MNPARPHRSAAFLAAMTSALAAVLLASVAQASSFTISVPITGVPPKYVCKPGSVTLNYTGAAQSAPVSKGCRTLTFDIYGAGGSAHSYTGCATYPGAAGPLVSGTVKMSIGDPVTLTLAGPTPASSGGAASTLSVNGHTVVSAGGGYSGSYYYPYGQYCQGPVGGSAGASTSFSGSVTGGQSQVGKGAAGGTSGSAAYATISWGD